ncbi:MAG: DUF302 domain-containing protein [Sideroxydans sp.]|jgi:uncharacterized protein (DUF302 family)
MKLLALILAATLATFASLAQAADGFITVKSSRSVAATMERVEALAKLRGMTVFARIDHAVGAAKIGKTLRPTQVIIFGNPKGGTPFIECAQTVGIDLPLKMLVWQDANGQVWLGYNDPAYLALRHGAGKCAVVSNLRKALDDLAEASSAP